MSGHQELLWRAIQAAPEDDFPRLLYADWLEEQGDPIAEFLRLQCEADRPEIAHQRRDLLYGRCWHILQQVLLPRVRAGLEMAQLPLSFGAVQWNGVELLHERRSVGQLRYERGFAELRLPAEWWARPTFLNLPAVQSRSWLLLSLVLLGPLPALSQIVVEPDGLFSTLTECVCEGDPYWKELPWASLPDREWTHWRGTERLRLLALPDQGLRDSDLLSLIHHGSFDALTHLDIRNNDLGWLSIAALLESERFPGLQVLHASANALGRDRQLRTLSQVGCPHLQQLDLEANALGGVDTEDLASLPQLPQLRGLNLARNQLRDDDITALLRSPLLTTVETLDLAANRFSWMSLARLLRTPHLLQLRCLDLASSLVDDHHDLTPLPALEPAQGWPAQLRELDLSDNSLIAEELQRILGELPPLCRQLRSLNLDNNWLDERALALLLASAMAATVERLSLARNRPLRDGIGVLRQHAWPQLRELDLSHNELTDAEMEILAAVPWSQRLERLDLRSNAITIEGIEHLKRSPTLPRTVHLDLRSNPELRNRSMLERTVQKELPNIRFCGSSACSFCHQLREWPEHSRE